MKPAPKAIQAAALASLALACASSEVVTPAPPPMLVEGRIARVEVAFADHGTGGLTAAEARRAAGIVRQSARDWLEHRDRLRADGDLAVSVTLDSLHLRGNTTTWLFAWAVAPDHSSARVVVRRHGEPVADFPVRVESALSGYGWRAREERLERLARRLGHRLAARLEPGPATRQGGDTAL